MKKILIAILSTILLFSGQIIFSALDTETLYEQGMEALKSGNYSSAELLFRKVMDSDEDEIADRAWFHLAKSIYYQKNYKSAVHEFTSYLNKCRTTSLCQESRYWIGESYYYLKQYNNAIEEYKRYIGKNGGEKLIPYAHDRIAAIYYSQKRYDEAVLEWEQAVQKSSDKDANAFRILNIGEALFQNGQYDNALARLSPLLTSRADPRIIANARIVSGKIYQLKGNHNRALVLFSGIPDDLLKKSPYSEAQYFKALSLIQKGESANAKSLLEIYVLIAREDRWYYHALRELGKLNIELGETEKGIEQLNDVRKSSDIPELKQDVDKYLGEYYIEKDPARAIPYLEEYRGLFDDNKELMLSLSRAYISVKRYDDAGKILEHYQEKFPYDRSIDQVKFLRARIFLEKNETLKAMELFESIRKDNPFSEYINESNFYLSIVHYRNGDFLKAVTLLNTYLGKRDIENRYQAYRLLASCYLSLNDLNRARSTVNLIINRYSDQDDAHEIIYRLAMALNDRGINPRWYMNNVIQKYPDSDSAYSLYLLLGGEAFKNRKYDEASSYYGKYLETDRTDSRGLAFFNMLVSQYNLKKYQNVIDMLKNSTIPPLDETQWKEIPILLARCYYETGQNEKIYTLLMSENISGMPKDVIFMFISSAVGAGDISIARERLQYVAASKELYAESLYSIASYYVKNRNMEEASSYYSKIIVECPGTEKADFARYEYAKILFENQKTGEAIEKLKEIRNRELNDDRNALLVLCYFSTGDEKNATILTNRYLSRILKNARGEEIIRKNLQYYFDRKNTGLFKRFAYYLANSFAGTQTYVNYMYGKYYYSLKSYKTAYYYLYKVSSSDNEYSQEVWYTLANISIFVNKNTKQAVQFFLKVIEKDSESDYGCRARIELSIIYHENDRKEESKKLLADIIADSQRKIFVIQAENLYDSFKYADTDKKTTE